MADNQDLELAPEEETNVEFTPLVKLEELPEVKVVTHEEDEEPIFRMRAKLFRWDEPTNQWKERGTGDIKFLKHKKTKKIRVLMRREKTLKVCANHFLLPALELKKNSGSDRSWVYTCPADFAEEEPGPENFAIRFATPENATKFKNEFEICQKAMKLLQDKASDDDVEKILKELSLTNLKEDDTTTKEEKKD